MAIDLEIWEDAGNESLGRGTVIQEIDNLGWKNSALDESYPYAEYPIGRPYSSGSYVAISFPKYVFFKISGTYSKANTLRVFFEGTLEGAAGSGVADNIALYYKWTNTYTTPTANLINGTYVDFNNLPTWNTRLLSTTGPNGTLVDTPELAANTTYYTPYLVTQLIAHKSTWDDYGNIGDMKLRMTLKERKSGLPGYDPDLVNWTW